MPERLVSDHLLLYPVIKELQRAGRLSADHAETNPYVYNLAVEYGLVATVGDFIYPTLAVVRKIREHERHHTSGDYVVLVDSLKGTTDIYNRVFRVQTYVYSIMHTTDDCVLYLCLPEYYQPTICQFQDGPLTHCTQFNRSEVRYASAEEIMANERLCDPLEITTHGTEPQSCRSKDPVLDAEN